MDYQIIRNEQHKTSLWEGGSTTELFIHPQTADYKQLNFDFRISTAKIELEKSNFTSLPNISRKLIILDGEILIKHTNKYNKVLKKFNSDNFEGDWETTSEGTCTDFNLMIRGKTKGDIEAFSIKKSTEYLLNQNISFLFVYCFIGNLEINLNQKTEYLHKGDLLIINHPSVQKINFITNALLELAVVTIL